MEGEIVKGSKLILLRSVIIDLILNIAILMFVYYFHYLLGRTFCLSMIIVVIFSSCNIILYIVNGVSSVELNESRIAIRYYLKQDKMIPSLEVKNFSITNNILAKIFYSDNRKPEKFRMDSFRKSDKELLFERFDTFLRKIFAQLDDSEIDSIYDYHQYDFMKTEKHRSNYLGFMLIASMFPVMTIIGVLFTTFVLKPEEGVFSVIEIWVIYPSVVLPLIVYWWDKLTSKRTLRFENGILTLSKNHRILITEDLSKMIKCHVDYKEIQWSTADSPKKTRLVGLLGFSQSDRKTILRNIKLFWSY